MTATMPARRRKPQVVRASARYPYTQEELDEIQVLKEMPEEDFRACVAHYVGNPDRAGNRIYSHPDLIDDTYTAVLYLIDQAQRRVVSAEGFKKNNREKGTKTLAKALSDRARLTNYLHQLKARISNRSTRQIAAEMVGKALWHTVTTYVARDLEDGFTRAQAEKRLYDRLKAEYPQVWRMLRSFPGSE